MYTCVYSNIGAYSVLYSILYCTLALVVKFPAHCCSMRIKYTQFAYFRGSNLFF